MDKLFIGEATKNNLVLLQPCLFNASQTLTFSPFFYSRKQEHYPLFVHNSKIYSSQFKNSLSLSVPLFLFLNLSLSVSFSVSLYFPLPLIFDTYQTLKTEVHCQRFYLLIDYIVSSFISLYSHSLFFFCFCFFNTLYSMCLNLPPLYHYSYASHGFNKVSVRNRKLYTCKCRNS